jgi:hypothetical protein
MDRTKTLQALGSGFAGALAVTALNESARRVIPHAPRLDALGMRALARTFRQAGETPPQGERLRGAALAGDLLSNTLYYSLAAAGGKRRAWLLGTLLGAGAGAGAAWLPPRIGLGRQPGETAATRAMTVAWYLAGGLAAAGALTLLNRYSPETSRSRADEGRELPLLEA